MITLIRPTGRSVWSRMVTHPEPAASSVPSPTNTVRQQEKPVDLTYSERLQRTQTRLIGVQTVAIVATFIALGIYTCDTHAMAGASQESTAMQARSYALHDRPWMVVGGAQGVPATRQLAVVYKNVGTLPAMRMTTYVAIDCVVDNQTLPPPMPPMEPTSVSIVGAGESAVSKVVSPHCLVEQGQRLVIHGNVNYYGPGPKGEARVYGTTFCQLYHPELADWQNCDAGNEAE
jgi:hypothetical protein